MSSQNSSLYSAIILITLVFFIVALGLVFLVTIYIQCRKKHLIEKQMIQHQFESELLKTLIEVQEQTMQTIATDLHDNIGQLLSLTTLTLNSIDFTQSEKNKEKITTSLDLVNKSIKELRDLAKLFQGEQLIEIGLNHAIHQEINWLEKSERYRIKAAIELDDIMLQAPNKDLIILRLLQEILNNIIKHSAATEVIINAYIKEDIFYLIVQDNGVGFNYNHVMQAKNGLGLHSLHKRIQLVNGNIKIESSSIGTNIVVEIPYP